MRTKLLLLIIFFFSYQLLLAQKEQVRAVEMTYWMLEDPYLQGFVMKKKMILNVQEERSIIQINYAIPPGATDTTNALPDEKRETVVNKEGQTVNKMIVGRGPKEPGSPKDAYHVYKNFKSKELYLPYSVLITGGNGLSEEYIVKDPIPNFAWRITEERKNIGGYECIKAVSQPFRGRVYEAWFAPSIPVSDGPWKLCGLPGLILEAEDESREIRFVFEKLRINPQEIKNIENVHLVKAFPVISWEDFKKKKNEQVEKMMKYNASKGYIVNDYKSYEMEKTR
jgi:GLPGLI family protein